MSRLTSDVYREHVLVKHIPCAAAVFGYIYARSHLIQWLQHDRCRYDYPRKAINNELSMTRMVRSAREQFVARGVG